MSTRRTHWRHVAVAALAIAGAAALTGCRGDRTDKPPRQFFPDMDNQQKWDPQEETDTTLFPDGRTARPEVPNTVAFGRADFDPVAYSDEAWAEEFLTERKMMLGADIGFARGEDGDGGYLDFIPVEVTLDLVREGRKEYNTFCAACHGYEGDGQGMVGRRWSYPPANISAGVYIDRAQRKGKDGYLYHVIREGVWDPATGANRMPGYKANLDETESWAVVAYLRALQRAQRAGAGDLTESERDRLGAQLPAEGGAS